MCDTATRGHCAIIGEKTTLDQGCYFTNMHGCDITGAEAWVVGDWADLPVGSWE